MTPTRVIDTQRLSTLANAYEREMAQFLRDLAAIGGENRHEGPLVQRIRQEMEKAGFDEIRIDSTGNIRGRIGSGGHVVMMEAQADTGGGGIASMVYAGKLIHELGMDDDFTLWVVGSARLSVLKENGIRPDCVLITEPTNLRIYRGQHWAPANGSTSGENGENHTGLPHGVEKHPPTWALPESHPLVQAAIATYETLFELPPVVSKWTAGANGAGPQASLAAPTIGFGPGEEEMANGAGDRVPLRHLVKAAQFYAAFPMTFVGMLRRR